MTKKEFIVEVYSADEGDILIWSPPKDWFPAIPVKKELVRCKDCKHRPSIDGEYENGFDLEFPTSRCPCQCDDGWYNWMPKDDWFCPNGERKEE